jgi:hypothetical protein
MLGKHLSYSTKLVCNAQKSILAKKLKLLIKAQFSRYEKIARIKLA